jgi:C1A family cysteine protease
VKKIVKLVGVLSQTRRKMNYIIVTVLSLLLLCSLSTCIELTQQEATLFKDFQFKFNKRYNNENEYNKRATIFQQNLQIVNKLNIEQNSTVYSHLTPFMDMSIEEFKNRYLMRPKHFMDREPHSETVVSKSEHKYDLPDSFDWRDRGAVSPVKDQASCGSCWAFSAIQAVESAWFIAGKGMVLLSAEQLVECDTYDW